MFKESNTSEDALIDPKFVNVQETKIFLYRTSYVRWIILLLTFTFYITNYFCYMLPASLQSQYQDILCNGNLSKYNLIQSLYSFPNIILPLVGGIIIQKIGMSFGMTIFTFFLLLGQFIQFVPYMYDSSVEDKYVWLLIGRAVFGIGGENMCITINSFISKWFNGQEQSLALAIVVSSAGLGMVVSGITSNPIYSINNDLFYPQLIGVIVMFVGFIIILIVYKIDQFSENHDNKVLETVNHNDLAPNQKPQEKQDENITFMQSIYQIKDFPFFYWICCGSMIVMYGQLIPFQNNLINVLLYKYNIPQKQGSKIFTLPLIIQLGICPLGGLLVDKIGKRAEANIISCLFMVAQFATWAFWDCPDFQCSSAAYWVPLVLYGIGNSVYNNFIWPAVALSLDEKLYGTGFGLLDCIQQLGIAVFPLIASAIFEATQGDDHNYFWFFIFFGSLGVIGTVLAFIIYVYDKKHGNILDTKESDEIQIKNKVQKSKRSTFII